MKNPDTITVLYVGDGDAAQNVAALRQAGYRVLIAFSVDHAVALTIGHAVNAVVLDQQLFIEIGGWSAAQSFKLANPGTCVILVIGGKRYGKNLPKGVDAVIKKTPQALIQAVRALAGGAKAKAPLSKRLVRPVSR